MLFDEELLHKLYEQALRAARAAAAVVGRHRDRPGEISHKDSGSNLATQVVTEVDLLAQKEIERLLRPTCAHHDLAWLSEESPDDGGRLQAEAFWAIDPLDGTLPFIERIPGYAVSIALVTKSGRPLLGVVVDPHNGTTWSAIAGQGLWRNGAAWQPDRADDMAGRPVKLFADRSLKKSPRFDDILNCLEAWAQANGCTGVESHLTGGAVMNACSVLENAPACYVKPPKSEAGGGCLWDYAATACLFAEAGLVATDFFGAPLDLNRSDSLTMNHRGICYCTHLTLADKLP